MLGNLLKKVLLGEPQLEREEAPWFDLGEVLRARLYSEKIVPPPSEDVIYRASGLGSLCEREEALKALHRIESKQVVNPDLQIAFDMGHGFHHMVQNKWLGPIGLLLGNWTCNACGHLHEDAVWPGICVKCHSRDDFTYQEFAFESKEIGLSGHPDGILVLPGGHRVLLEIKTVNSKAFDYLLTYIKGPMPQHVSQVQAYMHFMKMQECHFLYVDKDRSQFLTYRIAYDEQKFNVLVGKVALIRNSIRSQTVPPRYVCSTISCARAKRCSVRQKCFSTV